jgi:hypothetical protein
LRERLRGLRDRRRGEPSAPAGGVASPTEGGASESGAAPATAAGAAGSDLPEPPRSDPAGAEAAESPVAGAAEGGDGGAPPGPIGRLAAAGSGVAAGVRRAFADVGGGLRSAGDVIGDGWLLVPVGVRHRVVAGLALAGLLALLWFVLIPAAPCSFPGGDECPPADDAIALVPDQAWGYVHANVEYDTEAYEDARELARRLPLLGNELTRSALGLAGEPISFEQDVRPWGGGELAVALMPGPRGAPEPVLMIEADDEAAALEFARARFIGAVEEQDAGGVEVQADVRGRAAAVVGGFLMLGPLDAVRELAEDESDGGDSLEDLPAFTAAREQLPEKRFLDAYLAPEAARALFGPRSDLAPFRTFAGPEVSEGIAFSAGGAGDRVELAIRSVLDPERPPSTPAPFAQLPLYEPALVGELGEATLGFVGIGEPAASLEALLGQARASAPGLARGFERLVERVRRQGGIDIEGDLIAAIGGEIAVSIEPGGEGGAIDPAAPAAPGTPYLTLTATDVDTEAALRAMARLQGPIAASADPVGGEAPAFRSLDIDGVEGQSLRISPVVELTYAAWEDRLVVSTQRAGIERALEGSGGLAETPEFERATERFGEDPVSLLGYLQLRSLLELGEQVGLAEDPLYAAVASDLRALEAAALAVRLEESLLATDADLTLGAGDAAAAEPEAEAPAPPADELPELPELPQGPASGSGAG